MAIYAGNIKKPVGFDQQDYPETGYVNPATGFPTAAGVYTKTIPAYKVRRDAEETPPETIFAYDAVNLTFATQYAAGPDYPLEAIVRWYPDPPNNPAQALFYRCIQASGSGSNAPSYNTSNTYWALQGRKWSLLSTRLSRSPLRLFGQRCSNVSSARSRWTPSPAK